MSEYKFEDLTKHSVIRVPWDTAAGDFSEGEYIVYGTGSSRYRLDEEGNPTPTISLLYEDNWGECDPFLESLYKDEFEEAGCEIVSIPDAKTQETINQLDGLLESLNKQAEEIEAKAKEAGLDYEIVVLSDVDDIATWRSSRC